MAVTPVTEACWLIWAAAAWAVTLAARVTVALPVAPLMVRPSLVTPLAIVAGVAPAAMELPAAGAWACTPPTTVWLLPYWLVRALAVAATMVWLALAPIWNCAVPKVPSSSFWPLNSVLWAMRSSSATSWLTSWFRAWRSEALLVALADCTASSRTRCRMSPAALSAPSVVCARDTPSLALRAAWFRPRIWLVKRSEIDRPAASSLALLMRRPDDRRWIAVESELLLNPW